MKQRTYVCYVVMLNGKYADGLRNWEESPLRAHRFLLRYNAEVHASTFGRGSGIKIRRRTLTIKTKGGRSRK